MASRYEYCGITRYLFPYVLLAHIDDLISGYV